MKSFQHIYFADPIEEFMVKGVIRYNKTSFWTLYLRQQYIAKRMIFYLNRDYDILLGNRKWLKVKYTAQLLSEYITIEMLDLERRLKNGEIPPDEVLPRDLFSMLRNKIGDSSTEKVIRNWCTPTQVATIIHRFFPLFVHKKNPAIKNLKKNINVKSHIEFFKLTKLGRKLCGLPEITKVYDELQGSDTENQGIKEEE